ncbi:MAG: DNA repair protein RecN [Muribaculaceae bacterium]
MLTNLIISNYALIESIEINFNKGFSIITGETGAGKSIMLGALSLILGERVEPKAIRDKDKKSVIEAVFDLSGYELKEYFNDNDLEYDASECILRREILSNGRSRAFINDTPVTINQLRDLSLRLIDIHSQHNNLLLADSHYQLTIIDSIAGNNALLSSYTKAFSEYNSVKNRLFDLTERIAHNKTDEEYTRFLLSQLSDLNLKADEEAALEEEQNTLSNITEIKSSLWEISNILNNDDDSVISRLISATSKLSFLARIYSPSVEIKDRIDSTIIELKDISATINSWQDNMVDDPAKLSMINDRLSSIFTLKKKHNVSTVNDLIDIERRLNKTLSEIDNSENDILELEKELKEKNKKVIEIANQLSANRKKAAKLFSEQLSSIATPLGMKNLQCNISCEPIDIDKYGIDKIQFLFAFNKNQELLPVSMTASGGEISRLMLCVKTIIAKTMQLPTIIFDEIDTGVSGDIATRMGEMMSDIGSKLQVIAITHLPQVASMGDFHYKVFKKDTSDSTFSDIKELSYDDRVIEIAGMLSGRLIDDAAINNAKSLLNIKQKK